MGHDVVHDARRRAKRWAWPPQEIALYEDLSAIENLDFWGGAQRMRNPLLKARIPGVLEITGLQERAREPVKRFSAA